MCDVKTGLKLESPVFNDDKSSFDKLKELIELREQCNVSAVSHALEVMFNDIIKHLNSKLFGGLSFSEVDFLKNEEGNGVPFFFSYIKIKERAMILLIHIKEPGEPLDLKDGDSIEYEIKFAEFDDINDMIDYAVDKPTFELQEVEQVLCVFIKECYEL